MDIIKSDIPVYGSKVSSDYKVRCNLLLFVPGWGAGGAGIPHSGLNGEASAKGIVLSG